MTEDDLAIVDQRAAAAVAALDEAISATPVPDWEPVPASRPERRWLPAAIAASVLVVALVAAAALVAVNDDGEDQTATANGTTVLALPDPEAIGLDIVGVFDRDGSSGTHPGADVSVTVQIPAGTPPERADMVVEYALPADLTTLDGEPVDIGVPGAVLDQDGFRPAVTWPDGESVRFLMSADLSAGELVALASAVVRADRAVGAPLPGHEILHAGPVVDVFPMLASNVGSPGAGYRGVVYGTEDQGFVVAVAPGSLDRWLVARALATEEEQVEVRGRPAVLASFGDGIVEVSWLEADGTLVRVDSAQGDIPLDLLDQLRPISEQEFELLVEQHPIDRGDPPGDAGSESDEGTEVAAAETSDGDVTIRASILSGPEGDLQLRTFTEGPNTGSGSERPITDLRTAVVVRDVIDLGNGDERGTLLAGLIGPGVSAPRVVDAETGEDIVEGTGPLTTTIEGSDHVLFLATLPAGYEDRDLAVVGTSSTGEKIRLESPAG